ncbi:MAG: ABC transporter ATP-binding protein, partial [Clostridia bacterium]
MLMADKWITLLVVLMTPLSLFVAAFIAKKSFRHFRAQSKTQGELAGFIEEMVTNESLIKSFAREERCEAEFDEINARLYVSGQKSQFAASLSNPSTRFVNALVYAAVGVAGAISAINGRISIGQISMFLSYAHQYTKPFNEITGIITQLQSAMSSLIRVFDVFDKPPECADAALTAPAGDELVFNHVSFGYAPGKEIIHDLNLTVRAGTRVAIVGPTGCGKTTLINLILRFYEVNSGEITVGGAPIRDFPRDELRSRFGMVLQDSWLFGGTVRENIAFSRADATDYAIKRAAQDAYADSFISRLPNGYDTIISQDGSNISAGQRQLLSIARVMLADPPILILDEATSSIDTRTEQLISKAFDRMMAGRTSIVVAHRLSTIRSADMIYAVHGGRIVECGRHEELLAKGGFYADLYNSQFATA